LATKIPQGKEKSRQASRYRKRRIDRVKIKKKKKKGSAS